MRSLNADSFRPSLIGLILAMILLTAWLAWFFLARIGLYEVSQTMQVTADGIVVADFSPESKDRIWPGQPALIHLDSPPEDLPGTFPALVMDVTQPSQQQMQTELIALAAPDKPILLPQGLRGRVEVEVERVSPATLVVHATGQLLDTPSVSLSPQSNSR
jgi:hypothetical protein